MRTSVAAPATLALILAVAVPGHTQQGNGSESNAPCISRVEALFSARDAGERAMGLVRPSEKPRLVINSGDTVSIETISHSLGQIKPGVGMDGIVKLAQGKRWRRPALDYRPHLRVRRGARRHAGGFAYSRSFPKPDAFNFNLPGRDFPTVGLLAQEFPEGFVRYYKLDLVKMQTQFKAGIMIDLQPFLGTFAVGSTRRNRTPRPGHRFTMRRRTSTLRPWKNGSNMDLNEAAGRFDAVSAGVSPGRLDLDRRFPLPPGQRVR